MIIFDSVTKSFKCGTVALQNISFEIKPGELVLVTGPSGSGKTTLMRLLIKEYQPSEGEIFFDGKNLQDIKRSKVAHHRRKVGVVFQDYKLLKDLNVWENIALPLYIMGKKQKEINSRVTDLLKLIQLSNRALMFPVQLSGGEAQRVSIARALAMGPKVIFADEPTGNLDPDTASHIINLFKKINDLGTTVLLATHDQKVIDLFTDSKMIELSKKGSEVKDTKKHKKSKKDKQADTQQEQDIDQALDNLDKHLGQDSEQQLEEDETSVEKSDESKKNKETENKQEDAGLAEHQSKKDKVKIKWPKIKWNLFKKKQKGPEKIVKDKIKPEDINKENQKEDE